MPVQLISQAEYAKRRGVSQVAVHKAVKAGRIALIEGKVDPTAADAQWQANTRARMPAKPDHAAQPPAPPPDDAAGAGYWDSRGRREAAEAELAELKLAEQRGELVRADDVRSAHAKRLAALREAILQIPARLAPVLAAESSQAQCHDVLQRELHAVLGVAAA